MQATQLTISQKVRLARAEAAEAAAKDLIVIVPVKEKACNKCFVVKPASQYSNNRRKEDGLQTSCKICQRQTNNEWRKRKRKKMEQLNAEVEP